ncbi:hypothetical protein F2Q68_00006298 [Brassica cretica]|uniref:RNase H type-1 domain-containing protein n=1 Tax=Brassica cretica TaxID=69181 RepID=A0A8S9JHI6_BRACR|nr:hypothetical protein F2Q68_00006298 [Brassica cretica]
MQTVLPQEAIEEAIGEVREVMRQYTACADPTESAARKERLRQAEEQGEVEEAAIQMVQANLENLSPTDGRRQRESPTPASRERVPATLRLGPQVSLVDEEDNASEGRRPVSLERIPAAQRLGPLIDPMETEDLPLMDGRSETTVKRKPGRSPGKKKIQGSGDLIAENSGWIVGDGKSINISTDPWLSFWKSLCDKVCLPPLGIVNVPLAPWLLWSLWIEINNFVFSNRYTSVADTVSKAICLAREWSGAQLRENVKGRNLTAPMPGNPISVTVQSDAAWRNSSNLAGLGWTVITTDQTSNFSSSQKFVPSALTAETLALREAVVLCSRNGIMHLRCESDSSQLIKAVVSGPVPSEIYGIVADITTIAATFFLFPLFEFPAPVILMQMR